MELIDKTTILEEIYRLRDFANDRWDIEEMNGVDKFLDKLIPYINSLKVKDVDLEEDARKWEEKVYLEKGWEDSYGTPHVPFHEIGNAFIEGGKTILKVQNGE